MSNDQIKSFSHRLVGRFIQNVDKRRCMPK
jgi:hypothetical protein